MKNILYVIDISGGVLTSNIAMFYTALNILLRIPEE